MREQGTRRPAAETEVGGATGRWRRLAALAICALAATAATVAPSAASAAPPRESLGLFCEPEGVGGTAPCDPELGEPGGIAIDPASGDVYVIDLADQTLHRFHEDGTPADFSALTATNVIDGHAGEADEVTTGPMEILSSEGGAFAPIETQVSIAPPGSAGGTEGDVYVTDSLNGRIVVFAPSGEYLGQDALSTFPCGVSVGPGGEVYVGSYEGAEGVYKLIPTAPATFTEAPSSPFAAPTPCQVAAGYGASAGYVFATTFVGAVVKLDATTGAEEYEIGEAGERNFNTLAVDPGSGEVFVALNEATATEEVQAFDASGAAEAHRDETIPLGSFGLGLAVNGATANVYASREGAANVEVFGLPPQFELSVAKEGDGTGTVTSAPAGIACGAECAAPFYEGETVVLKGEAGTGTEAVQWSGCDAVAGDECEVTVGEAREVKARFELQRHSLTIAAAGSGSGSVSCDGGPCAATYPYGTTLTLAAAADAGSSFAGFSGAGCAGTGPCAVTMNADVAVTATFDANPPPTPTPTPAPAPAEGKGTAVAAHAASVKGAKALLKLSCTGAGPCKGSLELTAAVKQGKKKKNRVIGRASFSIAAGKSATVRVKITVGQVKKALAHGHTVKARLGGSGIRSATVKLKPAKKKGKKHHKKHHRPA